MGAPRYVIAKEELKAEDFLRLEKNLKGVEKVLGSILTEPEKLRKMLGDRLPFGSTVNVLRDITAALVQTKVLTAKQVKLVEAVSRSVSISRSPDKAGWFQKNLKAFWEIWSMKDLPDRSSLGGSDTFMVGPLTFHNTILADKATIAKVSEMMESGWKYLSKDTKFKAVAYGDIFLVGNMLESNTAAWYNLRKDDVYLRPVNSTSLDNVHTFLHELGHRYWYKFMDSKERYPVGRLYSTLKYARNAGLKVGDVIPVKIRGFSNPVVVKLDPLNYWLSDTAKLSRSKIDTYLNFPTAYATTTVEEFFAECFAFYLMGGLKPDMEAKFLESMGMVKTQELKVEEVKPEPKPEVKPEPKPEPVVVSPPVETSPKPSPSVEQPKTWDPIQPLRDLYAAARSKGDQWTMDFAKSLAQQVKNGRELTPRQTQVLENKYRSYGISVPSATRVASRLFDIP